MSTKFLVSVSLLVHVLLAVSVVGQTKVPEAKSAFVESNTIDKIRYAVVEIRYTDHLQNRGRLGTGFLAHRTGYVITNAHVVAAWRKNFPNTKLEVSFRIPTQTTGPVHIQEGFQAIDCTVADLDDVNDLALLKTSIEPEKMFERLIKPKPTQFTNTPITPATISANIPSEGTKIMVSGFPLRVTTLATQEGIVASQTFRWSVVGFQDPSARSDLILIDVPLNHGNSGGPVYLAQNGDVIGVAEGSIEALVEGAESKAPIVSNNPNVAGGQELLAVGSGFGFVIPAKYVIALLDKNKVPHDMIK